MNFYFRKYLNDNILQRRKFCSEDKDKKFSLKEIITGSLCHKRQEYSSVFPDLFFINFINFLIKCATKDKHHTCFK